MKLNGTGAGEAACEPDRGENKPQDTLVEASSETLLDAGSTPAASTRIVDQRCSCVLQLTTHLLCHAVTNSSCDLGISLPPNPSRTVYSPGPVRKLGVLFARESKKERKCPYE